MRPGAKRQQIAALEARLSAAAPRVSLNYLPGGAGKIKVDGRALADGETMHPTQPVTLDIEGVGSITIAPGQSKDVARRRGRFGGASRPACRAAGARGSNLLWTMRSACTSRDARSRANSCEATAQLKSSAPEGIERLQRTHAELAAQAAALGAPAATTLDELETRANEWWKRWAPPRRNSILPCATSGRRTMSWSVCARALPAMPSSSRAWWPSWGRRKRRPRRARRRQPR